MLGFEYWALGVGYWQRPTPNTQYRITHIDFNLKKLSVAHLSLPKIKCEILFPKTIIMLRSVKENGFFLVIITVNDPNPQPVKNQGSYFIV